MFAPVVLRSVLPLDQVGVVLVPLDPAADERALRDDLAAVRADVVQGRPHQRAAEAGLTGVGVDLGVSERRGVAAALVGGDAEQAVAVPDLVPIGFRGIAHCGLHGDLQPVSGLRDSAGRSTSRSANVGQPATALRTSGRSSGSGSGRRTTSSPSSSISKTSGGERLAASGARAPVPIALDPAHRAPVIVAGSRLRPLMNDALSRSGSPETSRSGSLSNSVRKATPISRRARWAPRQKCGPWPPKPTCGFGSRARSKTCGSGNTSGSRLAAP